MLRESSTEAPPRIVYFMNSDLDAGGGVVDLSRVDVHEEEDGCQLVDVPVRRVTVPAAGCRAREELVQRANAAERRFIGDGLLLRDRQRDARTLRLEDARRAVDRWDLEHVLGPLLDGLCTPALVVFHGGSGAPRLDLRAALREGVRGGELPLATLRDIVCLPTWSETVDGLIRHLAELSVVGLPVVDPARTAFLIGPPPPDEFLNTLAEMEPADAREALVSMPSDVEALAWRAVVRADFVERARAAGHRVVAEATVEDLTAAPEIAGGSLVLLAHQDGDGIHMHDGPIAPADVRERLEARCGGVAPYTTVDLSVCDADRPGNLAAAFQSLGATVVLTRGHVGYEGGMFRRFLQILDLLDEGRRLSLPELHDLAWASGAGRKDHHEISREVRCRGDMGAISGGRSS